MSATNTRVRDEPLTCWKLPVATSRSPAFVIANLKIATGPKALGIGSLTVKLMSPVLAPVSGFSASRWPGNVPPTYSTPFFRITWLTAPVVNGGLKPVSTSPVAGSSLANGPVTRPLTVRKPPPTYRASLPVSRAKTSPFARALKLPSSWYAGSLKANRFCRSVRELSRSEAAANRPPT